MPLPSTSDTQRHYEIWRGDTNDGGESWTFTLVTSNSSVDNIRTMMPESSDVPILVWMAGEYITYQNFNTKVKCLIGEEIPDFQLD